MFWIRGNECFKLMSSNGSSQEIFIEECMFIYRDDTFLDAAIPFEPTPQTEGSKEEKIKRRTSRAGIDVVLFNPLLKRLRIVKVSRWAVAILEVTDDMVAVHPQSHDVHLGERRSVLSRECHL